jgi:hypothetical protein
MTLGLFKLFKLFGIGGTLGVYLHHQTSDKKLLERSGEGI